MQTKKTLAGDSEYGGVSDRTTPAELSACGHYLLTIFGDGEPGALLEALSGSQPPPKAL